MIALGACALASLLNPNGIEVWLYPWKLSRLLFASGIAWDLGHFAAARPWESPPFLLLFLLLLGGLLPLRRLRELSLPRSWGSRPSSFFRSGHRGLSSTSRSSRCRRSTACWRTALSDGIEWSPAFRRTLSAGVPAVLALTALLAWMGHPRRLVDPRLPEGAVRFLETERIEGRIFNHQNFGGYLLWRARVPVFWDGRNDVFAPLVREVTTTPFPEIADRYGIDVLLITEREAEGLLPPSGGWSIGTTTARSIFGGIALHRSWRGTSCGFSPASAVVRAWSSSPAIPASRPAAFAELGRLLAVHPENQRALYFRGVLRLYQGDLENARRDLEAALAIRENDQVRKALEAVAETDDLYAPKNFLTSAQTCSTCSLVSSG